MGWEARLRAATITLWIAFLLYPALSAETGRGTICVLPNSAEPPTLVSPGGSYNPDTLMLRIDKRQAVPWPHKKGLKIEGLDQGAPSPLPGASVSERRPRVRSVSAVWAACHSCREVCPFCRLSFTCFVLPFAAPRFSEVLRNERESW